MNEFFSELEKSHLPPPITFFRKMILVNDEMLLPSYSKGNGSKSRESIIQNLQFDLRSFQNLDFLFKNDEFWKVLREMMSNALDAVKEEEDKIVFFIIQKERNDLVFKLINNGKSLNLNVNKNAATHIGGFKHGLVLCRQKVLEMGGKFNIQSMGNFTQASITFPNFSF